MSDKRILFFGSPDFAVAHLSVLMESGFNIVGVVSQQDKPKGRGYSLIPTAVKEFALSRGLPVYTPVTLRDGAFEAQLKEIDPDLIVVVAYGKILPQYILSYPEYGCVNVHASLLPKYRGAAPINYAIMDGEEKTGITTMLMDIGLDTGDILIQREIDIDKEDDAGALYDKLAVLGREVLVETVNGLFDGTVKPVKQEGETCYASLIDNRIKRIDFNDTSINVYNKIRGLSPNPTAFTSLNGKNIKVFKSEIADDFESDEIPGTLISAKELVIKTADGAIKLTEIAPEGKRRMSGKDFMLGLRVGTETKTILGR